MMDVGLCVRVQTMQAMPGKPKFTVETGVALDGMLCFCVYLMHELATRRLQNEADLWVLSL